MRVPNAFYDTGSLHIRAYDSLHGDHTPCVEGDTAFYKNWAARLGGPVLELGVGTARVALGLAAAGHTVTGLDLSEDLLAIAREKVRRQPSLSKSPLLLTADMRTFNLGERFSLIIAPFRTFHTLLTPPEQAAALTCAKRHLSDGGRLILHLFDPKLDDLSSFRHPPPEARTGTDFWTGGRIDATLDGLDIDPFTQILTNHWRYAAVDGNGDIAEEQRLALTVRWTYRQELKHLLALAGFQVEAEHGDFLGGVPAHGTEQILVCRAG